MSFPTRGWQVFPAEPRVLAWLAQAGPAAIAATKEPENIRKWLRCAETWFAGVNVLGNDTLGRVGGSGPLAGAALEAAQGMSGALPLHPAQVSAVYPGYPRAGRDGESPAAFRYRRDRDAAHLDGLLPVGPRRRRFLREPHAWILGLPVTDCGAGAAPLVVWEGSHEVLRHALGAALREHPETDWPEIDLTEAYHAARRQVFEHCNRVEVSARPGQAILLHRLLLHGVAPWRTGAEAPPEGRVIVYFRPELPGGARDWLDLP